MNSDSRWRLLLSALGVAITLSSVAGELSGYFHFIGTINEALDNFARSAVPSLSNSALRFLKVLLLALLAWFLCYIGLERYSLVYNNCTLDKWIYQVKVFLVVNTSEKQSEIIKTKLTLFLLVPLKALIQAMIPKLPGKRIFVVSGLQIHLWPYLLEVLFLHAILVSGFMAIYLGLKPITKTM